MRYRYFGSFDGLKVVALLLVISITPLVVNSFNKIRRQAGPSVLPNVTFQGSAMGGLTAAEVRIVVMNLSRNLRTSPLAAVPDPETGGIIPELNGYEVDLEQTVEAVLSAPAGTRVSPVFREKVPTVTIAAYPELPVYKGRPEKAQVAFLVNVAWGNEYLPDLLQALRETGAGATFFLVGRWVRSFPDIALSIREAGFELANHGDSDAISLGRATVAEARADIAGGARTIETVLGVRPSYFSPHRGELTDKLLQAAARERMRVIMWSIDTVDWRLPGVEKMAQKVLATAEGGSMILMHPTAKTAEFVRLAVPALKKKGLQPVSVGTLLCPRRTPAGVGEGIP
jgi:peptidoglycan/xylan/chitin deacetylase (PgdA/CDA1 family)